MLIEKSKKYAYYCHASTNHQYDNHPYTFHLEMVVDVAKRFIYLIDDSLRDVVVSACYCHDVIEDTRQTYNDVNLATSEKVADIVYALTNEKGKTRKERANDKYYQGIRETDLAVFAKMCDRIANVEYSLSKGTNMADMYKKETPNFISKIYDEKYDDMFEYLKEITGVKTEKI